MLVRDGVARIAVPAGDYFIKAFTDDFDQQGHVTAMKSVDVTDLTVADAPSTSSVTVDLRTATSQVTAHTPLPASQDYLGVTDFRLDRTGAGFGFGTVEIGGHAQIFVNQQPAAKVGKLHYLVQWGGSPVGSTAYNYALAFASDHGIAADQSYTATPDQLATVHVPVDTDPASHTITLLAAPTDPVIAPVWRTGDGFANKELPGPSDVTMYLGTADGGQWQLNGSEPWLDLVGDVHTYTGGHEYWTPPFLHGPLAPGFGQHTGPAFCQACTAGSTLGLRFPLLHDSEPDHTAAAVVVNAQLTLYRDGTQVYQGNNPDATVTGIPTTPGTYRAVLDTAVESGSLLTQSTATHTELTFPYAPGGGPGSALPAGDNCYGQAADTPCQLLPVLSTRYQLASDSTNTSAAPVQVMGLRVGHLSYDGAGSRAAITSASVSVSMDGGKTWQPALVLGALGSYVAFWPNPASAAGSMPWLRVSATDAAGGSITQTIDNAYTLASSTN